MAEKIGPLVIDLEGLELTPFERELLVHPLVGGVILFTRNYASPQQLQDLCQAIRLVSSISPIIMTDQEGGRVQRFRKNFTHLPEMGVFGILYEKQPELALKYAKDCGWLMAIELLSLGVGISLAPVLDLNKGFSEVIGDRAFHANPQTVVHLANAFTDGMREAGMAAVGKHFPGHGSVSIDSHVGVPCDERNLSEITQQDMIPFAQLIKTGLSAIMPAHIIFSKVDSLPVTYSRVWLQDILRKELGFTGAILSDDLNMEGANIDSNSYSDRVMMAREAGCDFVLLCNNRAGVIQVLDNVLYHENYVSIEKWMALHGDVSRLPQAYKETTRWQHINKFLLNKELMLNL